MAGGICEIETDEVEFKWEITQFSKVKTQMEIAVNENKPATICSNQFSTKFSSTPNKNWCLNLEYSTNNNYTIVCKLYGNLNSYATVQFSILNTKQKREKLNDVTKIHFNKKKDNYSYKIPSKYIGNDKLTIICNLVEYSEPKTNALPSFNNFPKNLLNDIKNLLNNEKNSDVTLMVNGIEFKVHKTILSARSPVFAAAMFSHKDSEESKSNKVVIQGTNSKIIKKFLEFIYSGKIEEFDKEKFGLWSIADKYHVDSLKNYCEQFISFNVNEQCVLKVLKFACSNNIEKLLDQTLNYFVIHCKNTIKDGKWTSLAKTHPRLFDLILNRLAQSH